MDLRKLVPNMHATGIIMKELVRRAIHEIRLERFKFEVTEKPGYDGKKRDITTSADFKAQAIYVRSLRECFPQYGIIAEEKKLNLPSGCPHGDVYFTVDPLCGTKAFERKQSHGLATMLALVADQAVIAAFIGDINTEEIYGYRPGSDNVWRISEYNNAKRLPSIFEPPWKNLSDQYLLLRNAPKFYSAISRKIMGAETADKSVFRNFLIASGSIGLTFAQLWKNEVAGVLLESNYDTPWDDTPVIGINRELGYEYLKVEPESKISIMPKLTLLTKVPEKKIRRRDYEVLVVHKTHLPELKAKGYI